MMRYFKLPLIMTAVALGLAIVIGCAGVTMIAQSGGSNRQKTERAQMLGTGVATLTGIIAGPFWIFAAAKLGEARRAAKNKPQKKKKPRPRDEDWD